MIDSSRVRKDIPDQELKSSPTAEKGSKMIPSSDNKPDVYPAYTKAYVYYRASGPKKEAGSYTGSTALAKAQGGPGVTLTISQTKSVSNSYSCNFSVPISSITAAVGFNVTSSESITVSGSATVPQYYNGRKVRSMILTAYPLYQNYTFSVTKVISKRGWTQHIRNAGSGTATTPIGCTFLRSYSYR